MHHFVDVYIKFMKTLQELGEAVAATRRDLGLKQKSVAEQAGITSGSVIMPSRHLQIRDRIDEAFHRVWRGHGGRLESGFSNGGCSRRSDAHQSYATEWGYIVAQQRDQTGKRRRTG